jgi:hypothetical protein
MLFTRQHLMKFVACLFRLVDADMFAASVKESSQAKL